MECFKVKCNNFENRLDPNFYRPEYVELEARLANKSHLNLTDIASFSKEIWNQKDFFEDKFPYIEISAIDTLTGKINNIEYHSISNAPSRAKMIVRENDIILSTTRPHRGAISMINKELDGFIASTGFAILRKHDNKLVDWNYLFHILRTELILKQLQRRSSGGNYPAITLDELAKILIPIPKPVIQREIINLFDKSLQRYNSEILKTKDLLGSIDKYVLSGLGIELPELKDKTCFIVRASEVKGNRLDPKCYSKIKKNIINSINKSNYKTDFLENLISKSLSGEWGCSPEEELDCESILCKVIRNVNFDNDFNLNLDDIAERKIPVHKYNNAKLEIGDILIEKSGGSPIQPVGRVAIIEEEYEDFFFSNFLRLIKIKKNICLPEYLFGVLKTFYRLNLMEYLQNQTTGIKNLIFEEYLEIPIPIPALPIQQKIADEVKSRMDKAKQLQIEARQTIEQAKKEAEKMILGEK